MKQKITKKFASGIASALLVILFMVSMLGGQKLLAQAYTITYTGLTGNTAAAGVPTGIINTTPYNGVTATCVTTSNGATTSYSTTITAAPGYNFTVTSVSGTAYASNAGSRDFSLRISSSNSAFTTTTSPVTSIGSSSSCAGNAALTPLTGTFTVTSGNSCTITVLRAAGAAAGTGYSRTKTLVISGTVSAATTAPTVTTNTTPTIVTSTSATLGGNVTATGGASIIANGIVYSLTSVNGTPAIGGAGVTQLATASPAAGTGAFSNATSLLLSPNTQYSYRAYASNASGTSYGVERTFYTLANTPNAPLVTNPTINSLDVNIETGDGNPASTLYAIQEAGGQYVQAGGTLAASPVFQTAATWGTKTVSGLNASTEYTFQVVARNGAAVNSVFGSSASGTTSTPTTPLATLTAFPGLTESNLDGGTFTITLQNVSFISSGSLPVQDFTLNNAPPGTDIINVEALSSTVALVTLSFEGADFDVNINDFSVSVAAAQLSSAADLISGSLSIAASVEVITISGTVGDVGSVCTGSLSAVSSYTISGTGLRDNVIVTAPADFEISLSNAPFVSSGPITLTVEDGGVELNTIYVRFSPLATGTTGNLAITHSSIGAVTQTVNVSGTGINTAPTVISPSSASVTLTGAELGGTITALGCAAVTERGIYWSTNEGFLDGEGSKVSETGSFNTGTFSLEVTGLPGNSVIFYKAFAVNSIGTVYTSQGSFNTLRPEPTDHPASFVCGQTTAASIPLQWVDAAGDVLPAGYCIKWSTTSFAAITDPVDGSTNNGVNAVLVNQGLQAATISGLLSNTTYYFKIYAYSNSGNDINYKTGALVEQTSCTTLAEPCNTSAATVNWNFTSGTANANVIPANLTVSSLTQGNNNGTTTLISSTSASSGYAGVSGTNNAGAAARTGALNTGSSAYFQFAITPATGYNVTLTAMSFGSRSTSTGPVAYALRSSRDNYASDITTGALSNGSTWQLKLNTNLDVAASDVITFRIYGYGGTGSPSAGTANWRIDDIILNVTVSNAPSEATVGADQDICGSLTSTALGGNTPLVGTGTWSQLSGPGTSTFSNVNSGASTATASLPGTYVYTWSISNGCATVETANVTVTVNPTPPAPAITAGGATIVCEGTSVVLTSTSATGNQWWSTDENGQVLTILTGETGQTYTATTSGYYTASVSNGECISTISNIIEVRVNPAPATPTVTAGGVTQLCNGESVILTSSSATGNQWWSTDENGQVLAILDGETQQTYTAANTGYYAVLVSNGECASDRSNIIDITVNPNFTITASAGSNGSISPNAITTLSCNGTGDQTYTITPEAGYVVGDVVVDGISLGALTSYTFTDVTINHTISVSFVSEGCGTNTFTGTGNWTDNERWSCGAAPASGDAIVIGAGSNATLNIDFTIAGSFTMAAISTLIVNPTTTLVISGTANFNGQPVVFKSTSAGTASLGQVTGLLTGATNVTVERYIRNNGFRSWRLLSVPVTGSQTIRQAWQEGTANPLPLQNNLPNYGTVITGTGNLAAALAAGFDDATQSAALLRWNGSGWTGISNTNQAIDNFPAYFLFIRGERSKGVAGSISNSSATTLRTTGTVYTGDTVIPATNDFSLIPNLYPSAISFTGLERSAGIGNQFYIWDSKKQSGNSLGVYQTFSGTSSFNCLIGGGSYVLGQPNTVIESGQAFFVLGSAGSSVTLKESAKISGTNGSLGFRPSATPAKIDSRLYSGDDMLDGNVVVFDAAYDRAVDGDDAPKMGNPGANFAIETQNKILAVEGTQQPVNNEAVQFRMWNLQQQAYKLEFAASNITMPGLSAELEDSYLDTRTAIDLSGTTTVNFTVDANEASKAANRFRIVFKQAAPLPITFISVSANRSTAGVKADWTVAAERAIRSYEVERSADGRSFAAVGSVTATGNNGGDLDYSFTDAGAPAGTLFYRIRSVGTAGDIKYSSVVKVAAGNVKAGYSISPNPVENGIVNLQFKNQPAGKYSVRVLSNEGKALLISTVTHAGGNSNQLLELPAGLARGTYQVEVISEDRQRTVQRIMVK